MHFEKRQRGLLREVFRSEGEGFSGGGGVKGRVSVLENEVNTASVSLNKNERRADSYVINSGEKNFIAVCAGFVFI